MKISCITLPFICQVNCLYPSSFSPCAKRSENVINKTDSWETDVTIKIEISILMVGINIMELR